MHVALSTSANSSEPLATFGAGDQAMEKAAVPLHGLDAAQGVDVQAHEDGSIMLWNGAALRPVTCLYQERCLRGARDFPSLLRLSYSRSRLRARPCLASHCLRELMCVLESSRVFESGYSRPDQRPLSRHRAFTFQMPPTEQLLTVTEVGSGATFARQAAQTSSTSLTGVTPKIPPALVIISW